jgi:hypothetical protein
MTPLRITCRVSAPDDEDLPNSEAHPFRLAIDEFADAIAAWLRTRGIDPDTHPAAVAAVDENGSLLTMSSDVPAWAAYFWLYLPQAPAAQAELMPIIIDHLSRAREALPDAKWKITSGDEELVWDSGRFHLVV